MMIFKKSLLVLLINILSFSLFAIEIADKKDGKLDLNTKVLLKTNFDSSQLSWEFESPGLVLELEGEMHDNWEFNISLDIGDAVSDDVTELLQEAYFSFDTSMNSRLKGGQFSVPFGEEETLGRYNRFHPSHSEGTKKIAPGTDRGVVFSLRNVAELFDFDFGLFNGLGTPYNNITLNNVLISSRQSIKLEPSIWISLEGGYAAIIEIMDINVVLGDFSHMAYVKLEYDLGLERNLFFLVEYMETHSILNTTNSLNGWELDLFTVAGFNYEKWDFFASFDYYRLNSKFNMIEDLWTIGGGINFRPEDNIKFTIFYEGENLYNLDDFTHKAGIDAYFRL